MLDSNKIRHALSGSLYAFEVPPMAMIEPTDRWSSVDRIHATERLESLSQAQPVTARHEEENHQSPSQPTAAEPVPDSSSPERENRTHAEVTSNELTTETGRSEDPGRASPSNSFKPPTDVENLGPTQASSAATTGEPAEELSESAASHSPTVSSVGVAEAATAGTSAEDADAKAAPSISAGMASPGLRQPEFDGFIFAFHRKMVRPTIVSLKFPLFHAPEPLVY